MNSIVFFLLLAFIQTVSATSYPIKASVVLSKQQASSNVWETIGTITFTQESDGSDISINGNLTGLTQGSHGLHVHNFGTTQPTCNNAGLHYNPNNVTHGSATSSVRHIGDLGNIQADSSGQSAVSLSVKEENLPLTGPQSIIGRTMVVHVGTDDLGQGGNDESKKTGNAGARFACGVIGMASDFSVDSKGALFSVNLIYIVLPFLVLAMSHHGALLRQQIC